MPMMDVPVKTNSGVQNAANGTHPNFIPIVHRVVSS
jgi:hypothetical protein